MPIVGYASLADVARAHRIVLGDEKFVTPQQRPISDVLRGELDFAENHVAFATSEYTVCENLIYPLLKDVWKSYLENLMLWSHEPICYDDDLSGTPDYFVSRRSLLGRWVVEPPYLVVVEAKRDDFWRGWGQCLAALLAAQKLNDIPELTLYGIATNGRSWEFAKLKGNTFTRDLLPFSLRNVEELCGAVHFVFEHCQSQVLALSHSA